MPNNWLVMPKNLALLLLTLYFYYVDHNELYNRYHLPANYPLTFIRAPCFLLLHVVVLLFFVVFSNCCYFSTSASFILWQANIAFSGWLVINRNKICKEIMGDCAVNYYDHWCLLGTVRFSCPQGKVFPKLRFHNIWYYIGQIHHKLCYDGCGAKVRTFENWRAKIYLF